MRWTRPAQSAAANRFFGSYALLQSFLKRWIQPNDRLRVADLATGSGDIPRLIVDFARSVHAEVKVDAIDGQPATLEIATKLSRGYPEIAFHEGNILQWQGGPYDIVFCSLVLHHFSEADAARVLQRCRELSRRLVLVSDLRRGWLASAGVYWLTALIFRNTITRYDGRLSAARAFSFGEMSEWPAGPAGIDSGTPDSNLRARPSGWRRASHQRHENPNDCGERPGGGPAGTAGARSDHGRVAQGPPGVDSRGPRPRRSRR